MQSAFKSVNLFPQSRFWRMGKKAELNHVFGGIASALLLIIIVSILILKLIDVFDRQTMTVISQASYQANMISTFSTDLNSKETKPVMVMINMSSQSLLAIAYHSSEPNQLIHLENCNKTHFAAFPQQYSSTYETRYCLPMGLNYPIDKQDSSMKIKLMCDQNKCNLTEYFTVTLFYPTPNVYQTSSEPWIYADQTLLFTYENKLTEVVVNLKQVRIKTDKGVFPFQQDQENTVGLDFQISAHSRTYPIPGQNNGTVLIVFQGSNYQTIYKRTFLKILDAFSYIGGIFNSLIAAFFFVKIYGSSLFEMNFARKLFRKKFIQNYGFFGFVKHTLYQILEKTSYRPEWEQEQKMLKMKKTVQHLMDVVQLHRRLLYLERALTVILQPHQLKGLQLVAYKPEELNENSKKFLLRDKLISFFKDKQKNKKDFEVQFPESKIHKQTNEEIINKEMNQSPEKIVNKKALESDKSLKPGSSLSISNSQQILDENLPNISEDPHQEEQDEFLLEELTEKEIGPCPEEMEGEIGGDLRRLFEEAEENSDERSKAIMTLIDQRIKQWLAQAIRQDRQRYRFKFNLAEDKYIENI